VLAMPDPTNVLTVDEVSMLTGRKMRPAAAAQEEIASLIARYNRLELPQPELEEERPEELEVELGDGPAEGPVVKLVQQIVAHAVELGASDIHLNPGAGETKVHYRVDGVLAEAAAVTRSMTPGVVSRIKIMAGINIAERRLPQDGTMSVRLEGRAVDVRVVTLPLVGGEGVVMRILDSHVVVRNLKSLGMEEHDRKRFEAAIARPYGAVLVTGPTGSGKSTTLYSALALINDGQRSIVTIEDPVESPVAGIKQMQVAAKAGLTFAGGLRSVLRADPDVIMVGEIRDRETAEIAAQAAVTGHLMLSTLHTRDAASAMTRLVDMGVEPFVVAAAIDCVIAQRLARALCSSCKRPVSLAPEVLAEQGLDGAELFEPVGCMRCGGTGFHGRIGLFEVMTVTDEIRSALLERRGVHGIAAAAAEQGMRTMRDDGLVKVRQGVTSLAEVARTTSVV
jgi:type IV pilus assembly protein PilB